MTDDELIAQLCLRIGMIMEDVSAEAVLARVGDRDKYEPAGAGVVLALRSGQ